ncbi:MAG: PRC-barrel domain-containing protein [Betaproteobacteria bacterium]
MASASAPSRDDHLVGTLNRRPALREATSDDRPSSKRDAVLLGATSFCGDGVYDIAGRFLGWLDELVLDTYSGRIAYALMSGGGFLGTEFFAIPWSAITVDRVYRRCVIKIDLERLIDAPGLDGDLLPRMADPDWATKVHAYYGCEPYWE